MWTNRSRTLFSVLILSITIFAVQTTSLAQTSVKVEPPFPSRMMKDDEITVKVKIDPVPEPPLSVQNIPWTGIQGCLEITDRSDEGGGVYSFTFKAVSACDAVQVSLKIGELENKFTLSIVPLINSTTLKLDPAVPTADPLELKQQAEKTIRLSLADNVTLPGGALKATSDSPDVALASVANTNLVLTPRKPGTAKITIAAYEKDVVSFNVQVVEAAQEIKAADLSFINEPRSIPLSDLDIEVVGKEGTRWTKEAAIEKLNFFSRKPSVVKVSSDRKNLEIVDAGEAQLEITAKDDPTKIKVINITVLPKASKITFSPGNLSLLQGMPAQKVTATIQDSANRPVPNVAVEFECQGTNCDAVTITPLPDNSIQVSGNKAATGVLIVATLEGQDNVSSSFTVNVIGSGQITSFKPLVIRMDMLDDQVARDLFGRKANDEYYIAKIQLFNNLKKSDTEYFGDSILVYSESLQVRVALEVKCKRGDTATPDCNGKEGQWIPVTAEMIGTYFFDGFSLNPPISQTEVMSLNGSFPPCAPKAPLGFVGLYRPYSFDTVAVTHERRDERSIRSQVLRALNGAISFTSFVTAIAVPGPGSDLPLGLDKSNNLLIPSFEKLFPSMKEVQRQNILTMVMRNLEEVPFGGNIERKLFFPKGALEGIWPGHRVRISAVSTWDACAEVAIVKKVSP